MKPTTATRSRQSRGHAKSSIERYLEFQAGCRNMPSVGGAIPIGTPASSSERSEAMHDAGVVKSRRDKSPPARRQVAAFFWRLLCTAASRERHGPELLE